ncbi:MAG TPA: C45 family peptidase [Actinomycetota bacterium]|nr:C45 family peptidase [Actinomycetota bacterium]
MTELRVVRAEGDAFSRGEKIGRELEDLIKGSVDFYHRYLGRRGVSSEKLADLLTPYLVAAEGHFPALMATLKGMSIGAMVPILELFAINAFEELEPLLESPEGQLLFLQRKEGYLQAPKLPIVERCSSFSIVTPERTFLAHNEHWLAGDAGNVAVVIDVPDENPVRTASPTIVCCLPAVGMNSRGGAQGIGSLTASDDGVGVPRVLVSRHSLNAANPDDATERAAFPARAGGYGHVFAFAGGGAVIVETTAKRHAVHPGPGVHTNHYLAPDLASMAPEASVGSNGRFARLRELIEGRQPTSVEDVMEIMKDHGSSPQEICLHPNPDEGEEASAVMFSMVTELETRRMWVAPGIPCENEYLEIDLEAVTQS